VDDEADFPGERTPFALSVGDADNLDRLDAYRIHESLALDGFLDLPFPEKRAYLHNRLTRLRGLLDLPMGTRTAEAIWRDRVGFYLAFCEKLSAQLQNSAESL